MIVSCFSNRRRSRDYNDLWITTWQQSPYFTNYPSIQISPEGRRDCLLALTLIIPFTYFIQKLTEQESFF